MKKQNSTRRARLREIRTPAPRWWTDYTLRRSNHYKEIQKYDFARAFRLAYVYDFIESASAQSKPQAELIKQPELIKATKRSQKEKLNIQVSYTQQLFSLGGGVSQVDADDGRITLDLGRGYFAKLPLDADAWSQQEQLLRLIDKRVCAQKQKQAILCRDSACRALGVKQLFQEPRVEMFHGENPDYVSGQIQVKGALRETVKILKHKQPGNIDTVAINGLIVTSPLETLLDVLSFSRAPDYVVSGDQLLRLCLNISPYERTVADWQLIKFNRELECLLETGKGRFNQRLVMRRLKHLSPLSESPLESLARFMLHEAGLKNPRCQYPIWYSRSTNRLIEELDEENYYDSATFYVDMAWPKLGLAVEIDGIAKYSSGSSVREEKNRENLIRLKFPRLLRLTSKSLEDWDGFAALLGSVLGR